MPLAARSTGLVPDQFGVSTLNVAVRHETVRQLDQRPDIPALRKPHFHLVE
jgi:hypothetical protein